MRSTSCIPASEREREKVCMCVGADLNYRAPSADFPPSSPRFHGRIPRLPRQKLSLSPFTLSLPLIPLFRSRRFNPGFSTQFGALHGGLYASARLTSHIRYIHTYTYTFSHPLLSFYASLPRVLPIYLSFSHTGTYTQRHTHTYIYMATRPYPGSSRLLFLLCSSSFSREQTPSTLFFPVLPILFLPPFTLPLILSLSLSFCLCPLSTSLYFRLSLYP